MAIEPVKIPADIQVEEKIIGPIGLRQIAILLATGAVSYIFFSIAKQGGPMTLFGIIMCWSPMTIGAAFAFLKVNDVGLFTLCLLYFEQMDKPTVRKFGPRKGLTINIRTGLPSEEKKKVEKKELAPSNALEELSSFLDDGLEKLVHEEGYQLQTTEQLAGNAAPAAVTPDEISAEQDIDAPMIDDIQHIQEEDTPPPPSAPSAGGLLRDIIPQPE